MNKKLLLILLIGLLLVVPAQAGLLTNYVKGFYETFGVQYGVTTNYADYRGYISFTDKVNYACVSDNECEKEYLILNNTNGEDDLITITSDTNLIKAEIQRTDGNGTEYFEDIKVNPLTKGRGIELPIRSREVILLRFDNTLDGKDGLKQTIYIYSRNKGEFKIDPYYNSTRGFAINGSETLSYPKGVILYKGNYYIVFTSLVSKLANYSSDGIDQGNLTFDGCAGMGTNDRYDLAQNGTNWFMVGNDGVNNLICVYNWAGTLLSYKQFNTETNLRGIEVNRSSIITLRETGLVTAYAPGNYAVQWSLTPTGIPSSPNPEFSSLTSNGTNFIATTYASPRVVVWNGAFINQTSSDLLNYLGTSTLSNLGGITNTSRGYLITDSLDNFAYDLVNSFRPVITNITIYPTPKAYSNDTLNCTFGIYDIDSLSTTIGYNVTWRRNGIYQFNINKSTGGKSFNSEYLDINNLTKFEVGSNWTCDVYAKDIAGAGDTNSSTRNITSLVTINSETYSGAIDESANTTITINITILQGVLSSANLTYNNTVYDDVNIISYSGNSYIISREVPAPKINADSIIQFLWNFNTTYEITNSIAHNQNIITFKAMNVTDWGCPTGFNSSLYFDFKSENNLTNINVTVNYNLQYGVTNNTFKTSIGTILNTHTLYLCINGTAYNNYSIGYGEIQYQGENYVKREYYIFNGQKITNVTINNTLYDLLNAEATSFLLTVKNPALAPYVSKYIGLLRWYPQVNSYYTVDMGKTDDKGQTVIRVKTEDTDYRLALYELNGTLIKLFNPIRMVCLASPCEYSAVVIEEGNDFTIFEKVQNDLTYDPILKTFTFIWNDPSQTTQSMTLLVQKERGDYLTTICDNSSSGYTGVINCNVSTYTGTIRAIAFRTASPETAIAEKIISIVNTMFKSTTGLFLVAMSFIFFTFVGIFSPIAAIIFGGIGLVIGVAFGTLSIGVVIAIGVLGGIIIHFMRNR
jgi:hypothetical protein